ncbi:MAG: hypothetical protein WKF97_05490 [Chitinophagaceae bacterium]
MMQFSVAPWHILDSVHLQAVNEAVKMRQHHLPYIMAVLRHAAQTGEPSLRPLEYDHPGKGYESIKDQFMMGDQMLVAPVVNEKDERTVVLPPGDWYYQNKKWKGGKTYHVMVALNELRFL